MVRLPQALAQTGETSDPLVLAAENLYETQTAEGGFPYGRDFEQYPDVDDTSRALLFLEKMAPFTRRTFSMLTRLIWRAGLRSNYRAEFWSMFWTQLRQGHIENIFQIAMVAHHLINYARDWVASRTHASNYAKRIRPQPTGPPPQRARFQQPRARLTSPS